MNPKANVKVDIHGYNKRSVGGEEKKKGDTRFVGSTAQPEMENKKKRNFKKVYITVVLKGSQSGFCLPDCP